MTPDASAPIVLHDVRGLSIDHVEATGLPAVPFARVRDVPGVRIRSVPGVADGVFDQVGAGVIPKP